MTYNAFWIIALASICCSHTVSAKPPATLPTTQPIPTMSEIEHTYATRMVEARRDFQKASTAAAKTRLDSLGDVEKSATAKKDRELLTTVRKRLKVVRSERPDLAATMPTTNFTTINIHARIDGTDVLTLTQSEASWEHRSFGLPDNVSINDVDWDLSTNLKIQNSGQNQYLAQHVDFHKWKVISRTGRDVVAAEPIDDGIKIYFADSPGGSDDYSISIQIPIDDAEQPSGSH